MPVPAKVLAAFKRKYGKKGEGYFYGMEKKHPEMVKKMVATAKKHGDKMVGGSKKKYKYD